MLLRIRQLETGPFVAFAATAALTTIGVSLFASSHQAETGDGGAYAAMGHHPLSFPQSPQGYRIGVPAVVWALHTPVRATFVALSVLGLSLTSALVFQLLKRLIGRGVAPRGVAILLLLRRFCHDRHQSLSGGLGCLRSTHRRSAASPSEEGAVSRPPADRRCAGPRERSLRACARCAADAALQTEAAPPHGLLSPDCPLSSPISSCAAPDSSSSPRPATPSPMPTSYGPWFPGNCEREGRSRSRTHCFTPSVHVGSPPRSRFGAQRGPSSSWRRCSSRCS